jgi:hypothetical protein
MWLAMACEPIVISVGDKKIEINEDIVKVLNEYARTEYNLEKLAEALDLEGWEEAYEFVKKVPAWILWVSPTLFRLEMSKCLQKQD